MSIKKDETDNNSTKKKLSRKQKILISSIAILTGFSGTVVGSSIIAYNALFPRQERPDYSITLGNFCYERVCDNLPREEFYFTSNKEKLKGYYYPSNDSKGLIVIAHGYHAGADDYLPFIEYFVKNNFNVFAYDMTATYDSQGDHLVGWCQALVDIDYALKYIAKEPRFNTQPLFLFGHSWGGYAVTSVLEIHKNVKACAGVAPMRDGSTIMMEKGEQYVGKIATLNSPIISAYQKIIFGNYVKHNGIKGINSVNIPVLIAQGIDDKVITYDKLSVIAHKDKITNPNVVYYEGYGLQGEHNTILHSNNAVAYQKEVASKLEKIKMENDGKIPYDKQVEFCKTVNHDLYSEVNRELMDKIIETFNNAL